jgi:hypothetical protein
VWALLKRLPSGRFLSTYAPGVYMPSTVDESGGTKICVCVCLRMPFDRRGKTLKLLFVWPPYNPTLPRTLTPLPKTVPEINPAVLVAMSAHVDKTNGNGEGMEGLYSSGLVEC